ncbi:MAG TPA: hypothetical protein VJG32_06870 [Anaerolineae bacterium]|nr:hypothetical protein [Anaerolineae bacterium]
MASYGISSVRYDARREYVTELRIHMHDGALYFPSSSWWKRDNVLRGLRISDQFVTLMPALGDKYQKDEEIHVVTVSGTLYLRVDNQRAPADDLGKLSAE